MTVVSVTLTDAGRQRAQALPYDHVHGDLAATVRQRWNQVDGFVLFCATGIAVRVVGPLLADKVTDPSVVCVDQSARWVVPLCGGHAGGANDLARDVAALLGATAVITTATDAACVPALDELAGFVSHGDLAGVARAWLDEGPPLVERTLPWPVPFDAGHGPHRVLVTDRATTPGSGEVVLHPPSLVVGVGASTDAEPDAAHRLLDDVLARHGLAPASVALVATVDRRAGDPVVTSLARPVRSFSPAALAAVPVPNPSAVVEAEIGTASVAEAAALLAAGPGAELVVEKHKGATATIAVARRARPEGRVLVVGLGPGHPRHRTPAASTAVRMAEIVVGYDPYLAQCQDLLRPSQQVLASPIGAEVDRCRTALERASEGATVALVCSGDAGVYAMASLVHELATTFGALDVEVVPGITAATAAAALLGSPLAHDHATISLSDLLTPWPMIERRLRAITAADLAVALYNPRSAKRTWQLDAARTILLEGRPPSTPVGIVTDAARPAETVELTTLGTLDADRVGMLSIVIVGSSTTRVIAGRMVTPRGYDP